MKINSVSLFNVGPYKTFSSMSFNCGDDKNIALIGGKNGAGKTTLFKSIQFCLYGCRALGYEVNTTAYLKEIKKILNINQILAYGKRAEVSVSISLENSTDSNDYIVTRSWDLKNDKIIENLTIKHGKVILNEEETGNFENLMLQLIPPDLFNFYFFNGEKIFEMLFDENSMNNFKNSFVKIIGLDTIDILIENFEKHAVEKAVNKKTIAEYEKAKTKYLKIKTEKNVFDSSLLRIDEEINGLEEEFNQVKRKYTKNKVLSPKERTQLEAEYKVLEENREKMRRFLKDSANNFIPFYLLKEQLKRLLNELTSSKSIVSKKDLNAILNSSQAMKVIKDNVKGDAVLFLNNLVNSVYSGDTASTLELSSSDKAYLIDQISLILSDLKTNEIITVENNYIAALERSKELKNILDDNIGERNEELKNLEVEYSRKIIGLSKEKEDLYKNMSSVIDKFALANSEYQKAKQNYESELKQESVSSISFSARTAFLSLRNKLLNEKVKLLKEKFITNFDRLINKNDLVSGINVDDELNVYPYKTIQLDYEKVKTMLAGSNTNLLKEQYGEEDYKKMLSIKPGQIISVNKKILGTMSAGESQIYVIALYMAMIQLSSVNIPIVIDTPFGRVDELHRTNIIDNFLKKMPNETLILSTDEEIIGSLYGRIIDKVSCEFTLSNTPAYGTKVNKGYFKE